MQIIDAVHEDVPAVRDGCTEFEHIGIDQRDDDEKRHACHEHVGCLSGKFSAPDSDGDHAGDKIRKPHCIRDDEHFDYGDHVIYCSVNDVEIACMIKAFNPEECGHVDDHVDGHRKKRHYDVKDLLYETFVIGRFQVNSSKIIMRSVRALWGPQNTPHIIASQNRVFD